MSGGLGQVLAGLASWIVMAIILISLAQNLLQAVQLALAALALAERPLESRSAAVWRRYAEVAPPISILAPAFNEAATVVQSARALLSLNYPDYEVILINDGSGDATLAELCQAFDLVPAERAVGRRLRTEPIRGLYASPWQPRLWVIDKVNGGKADALNAGINLARSPIVCAIDADCVLEPDALMGAVLPFLEDTELVIAVGGTVRVGNGCRADHGQLVSTAAPGNFLALLQSMEYVRAFMLARLGWGRTGALVIVSGAFGLFRRRALLEVGGYARRTVGEDMELVVRLHRHFRRARRPYRIVFTPEPVCWTEAPETLSVLGRQRSRWQRGALETFARHADMLCNPRYGRFGLLGLGTVLIVDVLGPLAEGLGLIVVPGAWALGMLSTSFALTLVALNILFGVGLSVGALALEETEFRRACSQRDLLRLLGAVCVENLGYRQLNSFWRLRGFAQFLRGSQAWGAMTRKGFRPA